MERGVERAGRDSENRGIRVGGDTENENDRGGRKRKRRGSLGDGVGGGGQEGGLMKGEAAFLRRTADAGVTVIRAPRGMSREKGNSSRWFPKYVKHVLVGLDWVES